MHSPTSSQYGQTSKIWLRKKAKSQHQYLIVQKGEIKAEGSELFLVVVKLNPTQKSRLISWVKKVIISSPGDTPYELCEPEISRETFVSILTPWPFHLELIDKHLLVPPRLRLVVFIIYDLLHTDGMKFSQNP